MKTKFENLEKNAHLMTCNALSDACIELADKLKDISTDMFSLSKRWCGRGRWKSTAFANSYYFGDMLSKLIVKGCSGIITFDEEKDFNHDDIKETVSDAFFEYLYDRFVY